MPASPPALQDRKPKNPQPFLLQNNISLACSHCATRLRITASSKPPLPGPPQPPPRRLPPPPPPPPPLLHSRRNRPRCPGTTTATPSAQSPFVCYHHRAFPEPRALAAPLIRAYLTQKALIPFPQPRPAPTALVLPSKAYLEPDLDCSCQNGYKLEFGAKRTTICRTRCRPAVTQLIYKVETLLTRRATIPRFPQFWRTK